MANASDAVVVMTATGVADELTRYLVALKPDETDYFLLTDWTREKNSDGSIAIRGVASGRHHYLPTLLGLLPSPNGSSAPWGLGESGSAAALDAWEKLRTALLERKDASVKVEYVDFEPATQRFARGEYLLSAETPSVDLSGYTMSVEIGGEKVSQPAEPSALFSSPEFVEEKGIAREWPIEISVENLVKHMGYKRDKATELLG